MDISEETAEELNSQYSQSILPVTVLCGLFAVVGVVGNAIVLVVFSRGLAYRKSNFRIFVICLGIVDLLTCAVLIPAEMVRQTTFFTYRSRALCKITSVANVWSACAAASCLLIVCIDRFKKVCQPFKKQISCALACRLCVILSLFGSFSLAIPDAVWRGIRVSNVTNVYKTYTTVYICSSEEMYETHYLRFVLVLGALLAGASCTYIVLYVCIWRQVRRHWKATSLGRDNVSGRDVPVSSQEHTSETVCSIQTATAVSVSAAKHAPEIKRRRFPYKVLIWFILIIVFIITYSIFSVLTFAIPDPINLDPQTFAIFVGFYRLYFLNNIINPIIYAAFDMEFREAYKTMFKRLKTNCAWCSRNN